MASATPAQAVEVFHTAVTDTDASFRGTQTNGCSRPSPAYLHIPESVSRETTGVYRQNEVSQPVTSLVVGSKWQLGIGRTPLNGKQGPARTTVWTLVGLSEQKFGSQAMLQHLGCPPSSRLGGSSSATTLPCCTAAKKKAHSTGSLEQAAGEGGSKTETERERETKRVKERARETDSYGKHIGLVRHREKKLVAWKQQSLRAHNTYQQRESQTQTQRGGGRLQTHIATQGKQHSKWSESHFTTVKVHLRWLSAASVHVAFSSVKPSNPVTAFSSAGPHNSLKKLDLESQTTKAVTVYPHICGT
ncbi:hypothetical protein JZ751_028025 [Albula glossodonta]|uniref:Uncharacterized protein n=1 Tax=Albula glossodonta TaxID=121402 RepID=A0A8T2PKR5_9TELE|nr:hypothetical protein JZ751_028025 [Albula glossodonta]